MSELKVAFSSEESSNFEQSLGNDEVSVKNVLGYFDVAGTVELIKREDYKKVALQFPNELLRYSQAVATVLEAETHSKVYVLADTSYGSCCIDEVSAAHVEADVIVHYGHSCLSGSQSLPVHYVFGRSELNVDDFIEKTKDLLKNNSVVLMYDVVYYHHYEVLNGLTKVYSNLRIAQLDTQNTQFECSNTKFKFLGRIFYLQNNLEDNIILFIGSECLTLQNICMRFNKNKVYTYHQSHGLRLETTKVNRSLMKRYYLIEKAKNVQIVGIVMGTLAVTRYKDMVKRLKQILKQAGKKYYTFIVGKINVPKLANFMEIDMFVFVACPENSLIDSSEFYKPIVTPYEMEIACLHNREWSGEYLTDFRDLLSGAAHHVEIVEKEGNEDEPEFSMVTGQIRSGLNISGSSSSTEIALRNDDMQLSVHQDANNFLQSRSWKGLQVNSGDTEVKKAEQGRSGIAMGYENENYEKEV